MRHWITVGTTLVVLALSAVPAVAAAPLRDSFDVDGTFPSAELTAACGVPVDLTISGRFTDTLWADHEIDTYPSAKLTYSNAAGGSITIPFSGILHASYPDGIFIGAPAIVTLTGNDGPFAGVPGPGSGRLVYTTVIEQVDDAGVPGTRLTTLIEQSGNFTGQVGRICDALT